MGYIETQYYINSLNTRGIKPGLDNEIKLLEQLNNPHHKQNFIHITGTNGKGSVGAYLSEILSANGKNVARFVSPCVGEYKNTFLYNGKPVAEDVVIKATDIIREAMDKLKHMDIYPTAFETEVALAFVIFNIIKPDYVLLECGMGGKNDATNVIPAPVLSVITKISMDHIAYLGDTLEDIAKEKAGIIKTGTNVVTSEQDNPVIDVIISHCKEMNVPLHIATTPTEISFSECDTTFNISNTEYTTKMLGAYQPHNASIAIECAKVLGINTKAIYDGIYNAQWEYRFQRIGKFILDGAHNPDGARALTKSIEKYFPNEEIAYICGCFKDKEYKKIAEITSPHASKVFCIKAPTDRGLEPQILCETFLKTGADATVSPSLKEAVIEANKYKNVIIFGSLSILHEAKEIIEGIKSNGKM